LVTGTAPSLVALTGVWRSTPDHNCVRRKTVVTSGLKDETKRALDFSFFEIIRSECNNNDRKTTINYKCLTTVKQGQSQPSTKRYHKKKQRNNTRCAKNQNTQEISFDSTPK
jgi:hypothetical protein